MQQRLKKRERNTFKKRDHAYGLGLGLAQEYLKRGWSVVGTVRGEDALHGLADRSSGRLEVETLDVVKPETIAAPEAASRGTALRRSVTTEEFNRIMMTNALGPMRRVEALADLVSPNGVIGVMSSGLGSIAGNDSGGWEVYRASKGGARDDDAFVCGAARGRW